MQAEMGLLEPPQCHPSVQGLVGGNMGVMFLQAQWMQPQGWQQDSALFCSCTKPSSTGGVLVIPMDISAIVGSIVITLIFERAQNPQSSQDTV